MERICRLLCFVSWLAGMDCRAEKIAWYSVAGSTNLTSAGVPMSAGFSFELGVFSGNFVPTAANTDQWAANWVPAQRVAYNGPNQRFDGQLTVEDNTAPFTVGKPAYIWGFQGGASSSEWILFRNPAWTWPAPAFPPSPFGRDWNAANATAIIGSIDADGSPFLMKSATVTAASPPTLWQEWCDAELVGEPLSGPNDDPDQDGLSNLLEYVMGTPPKQAGAPTATAVEIVAVASQNFLEITIPRRIDHPATLTTQVSSDLSNWASGPTATEIVSNSPAALVVRDLTPLGSGAPQRFMRLKAELPPP